MLTSRPIIQATLYFLMHLEQEMTVGWASYALAKSQLNVMLLDKLYSRITTNTADDRTMIILISSYYGWE